MCQRFTFICCKRSSRLINVTRVERNVLKKNNMELVFARSKPSALCNLHLFSKRHFSLSFVHEKKRYFLKKNPSFYEADRASRYNRTNFQMLTNTAFKKVPFDSKYPVTAKHTGSQVLGGSEEAAKLTALHGKGFLHLLRSNKIKVWCHLQFICLTNNSGKIQQLCPF